MYAPKEARCSRMRPMSALQHLCGILCLGFWPTQSSPLQTADLTSHFGNMEGVQCWENRTIPSSIHGFDT